MSDASPKIPPKHTAHGNYRRADHFEAECARLTAKLEVAQARIRELEAQIAESCEDARSDTEMGGCPLAGKITKLEAACRRAHDVAATYLATGAFNGLALIQAGSACGSALKSSPPSEAAPDRSGEPR